MKLSRNTLIVAILAVMTLAGTSFADWQFRGIPVFQGDNYLPSHSLNRLEDTGNPFFIDVQDNFNRDGSLTGSDADTHQIGFVPPSENVPDGYLQGQNASDHGRWFGDESFVTSSLNDGFVRRTDLDGSGIVTTPWRVESGLGDYYHIEMTAMVAAGETVSLGYLGDIDTSGATQGLAGDLGQLVLGITRGIGADEDQLTWTVSWDQDGTPQSFSSTVVSAAGEELNLQLGWLDQGNDDLFDAWLGDSNGNTRLLQGNMNSAIDVYDVGFFASGLDSTIGGFTSAVPEPTTGLMALLATLSFIGIRRRS